MLPSPFPTGSASATSALRGSIPHPAQSLCTLRGRRRRRTHATLATGRALPLTRTGLAPAGSRQLILAHRKPLRMIARLWCTATSGTASICARYGGHAPRRYLRDFPPVCEAVHSAAGQLWLSGHDQTNYHQEIVMTQWTPTPLRWTEEAEGEQVCTLAMLQREPRSAAVRPVERLAPISIFGVPRALLPRLLSWLTDPTAQIKRDGGR